ncbi:translocon component PTEX150, putative [Plasmodium malariae]|uniref:Translocon component PTEX150, putative n=1 Tax=Plasmodium malariae TaxID=5858 RepID=A0A1A8WPT9_PLAMA|nr:translocon component PTEX150, putative [Plasmodium malariae]SBS93340.1 translocon component PTEX150, putative [Plasmodium malariae]SCP02593.1 translocon component PTEX150, putative [Plasmodium malariae]
MKLLAVSFLIFSTIINCYYANVPNGNRTLNVKPTCNKSGKTGSGNNENNSIDNSADNSVGGGGADENNGNSDDNNKNENNEGVKDDSSNIKEKEAKQTCDASANRDFQNMMKPFNDMLERGKLNNMNLENLLNSEIFQGKGGKLNIENILNNEIFHSFLSSLDGDKKSGDNNNNDDSRASTYGALFKDMLSSFNNSNLNNKGENGVEGEDGTKGSENKGKNIQLTPEQLNKINELKDRLENVLKNAGVDVEKIKENIQNDDFLKNKEFLKDILAKLPVNAPIMNFGDKHNGNMFNLDTVDMMNMLKKVNKGDKMGLNIEDDDSTKIGKDDEAYEYDEDAVVTDENNDINTNSFNADQYLLNSNKDISLVDRLSFNNFVSNDKKFDCFDINTYKPSLGGNKVDVTANSINRKLSDGDSLEDYDESNNSNINVTDNNGSNGSNHISSSSSSSGNSAGGDKEELIASSSGAGKNSNQMTNSVIGGNHFFDLSNVQKPKSSKKSSLYGAKKGIKKGKHRKGGKRKKKNKKRNPGQVPFKMDTLKETVRGINNPNSREMIEGIIKKYISLTPDDGDDDDDDDNENGGNDNANQGESGDGNKEDELNINEFSIKDIKKLISDGILTYEDLTEEELRKLASPDKVFYELSPYATEDKDLSINETSAVSNEQLNAFLKKNGQYHMSYDSKNIDYLKQKKSEKKEEDQEEDTFYDAYKQIKNSYLGIPSNYYHEAPQLVGNNYVFTSVYDKKQDLINFLKRSNGMTVDDAVNGSGTGSTPYKSKFYDKYYKKLSEYRRREAFKILKKQKDKEKQLKLKQKLENEEKDDLNNFSPKNKLAGNASDNYGVQVFSKDQLENFVKNFNSQNNSDILSNSGQTSMNNNTNNNNSTNDSESSFNNGSNGFVTFDGKDVVGSSSNEDTSVDENDQVLNEEEDLNEDDDD